MGDEGLDGILGALADPTRRAIVARLAGGEASVTELASPFAISVQAVSKHLKVLEGAGLIQRTRRAQERPCRLEPQALATLSHWLDGYRALWESSFDRLADHLTATEEQ